ncbi:MAG: hypothetical protein IKN59_01810 [Paludibacteraceae bacterium]|nr:hypothetical protein [Paludibacteraceae bacterium]
MTTEKNKRKRNATSFNSETAKIAQKKSRESLRRNRSLREWARFYGKQNIKIEIPDSDEKEKATWDGAVIVGLYRRAMQGDHNAAKLLAELGGQAPEQNVNVTASVKQERELTAEEAAAFYTALDKKI